MELVLQTKITFYQRGATFLMMLKGWLFWKRCTKVHWSEIMDLNAPFISTYFPIERIIIIRRLNLTIRDLFA